MKDTNTIQLSDLNSDADPDWTGGTVPPSDPWPPLDQQTKMGSLDRLVRLETHEGNLWLFGRETIEVWYHSGDADFPFRRIQGATVDQGTSAPASVAQIDRKLYWLGRDKRGRGRVFRTEGYTPVPISNPAIEYLIDSYLDLGTDHAITGYGYQEDGQTFYVLSFPTYAQATLVYDLTTNMWHERARWNGTAWEQWRGASFHAHVWGKHIVSRWSPDGPYIGPDHRRLWEMNVQFPDDEGLPIRRQRIAPYVQAEQQFLQHHYLRLYTDSASNVNMRYRNDEGTAWSTPRVVAPYKHEVKYRRLGRARDRLYDIWIDDATKPPMIAEGWLNSVAVTRALMPRSAPSGDQLPLQQAVIDQRRLLTVPWVGFLQRLYDLASSKLYVEGTHLDRVGDGTPDNPGTPAGQPGTKNGPGTLFYETDRAVLYQSRLVKDPALPSTDPPIPAWVYVLGTMQGTLSRSTPHRPWLEAHQQDRRRRLPVRGDGHRPELRLGRDRHG